MRGLFGVFLTMVRVVLAFTYFDIGTMDEWPQRNPDLSCRCIATRAIHFGLTEGLYG